MKHSRVVGKHVSDLTGLQHTLANLALIVRFACESHPRGGVGAGQDDRQVESAPRDLDRHEEVRIVRQHGRRVIRMCAASQSRWLARLTSGPVSSVLRTSAKRGPVADGVASGIQTRWRKKMPVDDLTAWDRGEGPQIGVLPGGGVWVAGVADDRSGTAGRIRTAARALPGRPGVLAGSGGEPRGGQVTARRHRATRGSRAPSVGPAPAPRAAAPPSGPGPP